MKFRKKKDEIQDVIADGRRTPVKHIIVIRNVKSKNMKLTDKCVIEHRDGKGNLIKRHGCNEGLWHKIKVKLGWEHNSLNAQGVGDVNFWITGNTATPTAYKFIAIGTGTAVDTQTDTALTLVKALSVTPSISTVTLSNDTITWACTFSSNTSSGGSLTGTSTIQEVGIITATTSYRILIHISGTNYATAGDVCNWAQGDTLAITITSKTEQGA
jgi:hypothetical protein